jgi:hypothetical protein
MKPVRVHITGCAPRSGTTLMMELFRQCFEIEAFGRHEISVFVKPRPEPALYCSKRPQDILIVSPLLRHDENLWIVFLLRDPRDVIVSQHRLRPGTYWCHLGLWKRRYAIARTLWNHPRFSVVRYEDLAERPDEVQKELQARMPFLRITRPFSAFGGEGVSAASERALGGVRPVTADSIGAWRSQKGRVVSQLEKHGSVENDLIALGYEPDSAWLRALDGVEADHAASVYAETGPFEGGLSDRMLGFARSVRFHSWRLFETARYRLGASRREDLAGS